MLHNVNDDLIFSRAVCIVSKTQKVVNPMKTKIEDLATDLNGFFVANNLMSNDDKLVAMVIDGSRCTPIVFPSLSFG